MTIRIGILGAARIAPMALVKPARLVDGIKATAIAARDSHRAEAFAEKHGVPEVYGTYAELLEAVDAVYIPLPNALHAEWTLRAIDAGLHVLCEKPFTANAAEARQVAEAAARADGLTVMEAFHYRYHPLAARMQEIATSELGEIRHVQTSMCFPLPKFSDIRYNLELAGGATMDAGCYAIHCLRLLGGPDRPEVTKAQALLQSPGVDRAMTAEFRFPSGATGRITTSLWSRQVLGIGARVEGERGTMQVLNYVMPQAYHRMRVTVNGHTRHERVRGAGTYELQLRAFVAAVGGRASANLTPPADSVVTMELIDEVYRAAGLDPRNLTEPR